MLLIFIIKWLNNFFFQSELQGNKLTKIKADDLNYLKFLKVLYVDFSITKILALFHIFIKSILIFLVISKTIKFSSLKIVHLTTLLTWKDCKIENSNKIILIIFYKSLKIKILNTKGVWTIISWHFCPLIFSQAWKL